LLLAVVFLCCLFLLARAFQILLPSELNSALRLKMEAAASLAAEAGVQDALARMESDLTVGLEPTSLATPVLILNGTLGDWTWKTIVTPDAQTPPNGTNPVHAYQVACTASRGGRAWRTVTTWVSQQSFARFGWFQDEADDFSYVVLGSDHYEGPVFCNDYMYLFVPNGTYTGTPKPTFTSTLTTAARWSSSADGVRYTGPGGPPYDSKGNSKPGAYEGILAGGRGALTTGVKRIEMPDTSATLANAAWGPVGSPPGGVGVYVNSDAGNVAGGVYVNGTVNSMDLGVDASGNRTVRIAQSGGSVTVTETTTNPGRAPDGRIVPKGSTLLVNESNSSYRIYGGVTNGVIYSRGSIKGLKGVNQGRRTVATEVLTGTSLVISGSLTSASTTPGARPSGVDQLGLVSYKVSIPTTVPRRADKPLYLYAAIMAGRPGGQGGFFVDDYGNSWLGKGEMQIYGGLIISSGDITCTINGSGQVVTGFNQVLRYDPTLATAPPPYFPTLPKLTMRTWKESAVAQ